MNKTLSSIILSGVMALGYNSNAQIDSRFNQYDSINFKYKEFPQDTLIGYVVFKKNTGRDIIKGIKNGCKVKIITKEEDGYHVLIQKAEEEKFKDIHQDSLVTIYTLRVAGYAYNKDQFIDGEDLGMYAKTLPRKWSKKEYDELMKDIDVVVKIK